MYLRAHHVVVAIGVVEDGAVAAERAQHAGLFFRLGDGFGFEGEADREVVNLGGVNAGSIGYDMRCVAATITRNLALSKRYFPYTPYRGRRHHTGVLTIFEAFKSIVNLSN
jgi:hypothetical protein